MSVCAFCFEERDRKGQPLPVPFCKCTGDNCYHTSCMMKHFLAADADKPMFTKLMNRVTKFGKGCPTCRSYVHADTYVRRFYPLVRVLNALLIVFTDIPSEIMILPLAIVVLTEFFLVATNQVHSFISTEDQYSWRRQTDVAGFFDCIAIASRLEMRMTLISTVWTILYPMYPIVILVGGILLDFAKHLIQCFIVTVFINDTVMYLLSFVFNEKTREIITGFVLIVFLTAYTLLFF